MERSEVGHRASGLAHIECRAATGLLVVHGLGMAITESRAASEAENFGPLEDERISGRLGVTGY